MIKRFGVDVLDERLDDFKPPAASIGLDWDADMHDHHESFLSFDESPVKR
jgi:hypothetical protein